LTTSFSLPRYLHAYKEEAPPNKLPIPVQLIERRIYLIRGHKAMLDSDLAELYQVETKALNRAMKRNADRFPDEFMFHLTPDEAESLRYQIGTSNAARGGRRYGPYAFTEHGVAMLSSVLRSKRAVLMSILIVNGFVRLRGILATHRDLAQAIEDLRRKQAEQGEQITAIIETINQLHDILQYVRFKEPKADIIHKFGKSLRFYLTRKKSFPHGYFGLGGEIRKDISFRTLAAKFPQVEAEQTFYEQKVLRIIGTSYLLLMQDGHFDLASMCGSELLETGKTAAELYDKHAVSAVILHFNTLLRYGINHGLKTKEIRNVHNTIFHYSQLIDFLIKRNEVERIVECCNYFAFYGKEVRRLTHSEASFIFLIDAFATELKKILITLHDNRFDRELQLMVLKIFNELNSHQENGTADHRIANNGSRLIQISLCLYYIYKMEEEFNEIIIQTMISDFSGSPVATSITFAAIWSLTASVISLSP